MWGDHPKSPETVIYTVKPRDWPSYVRNRWLGGVPRVVSEGPFRTGGLEQLIGNVGAKASKRELDSSLELMSLLVIDAKESAEQTERELKASAAALPAGASKITAARRARDQGALVAYLKKTHRFEAFRLKQRSIQRRDVFLPLDVSPALQ